jgi:carboxylesterase type B
VRAGPPVRLRPHLRFAADAGQAAGHGLDLPFVFKNFFAVLPSAGELALADEVQAAWGRFAASGDPGAVGGVEWLESDGDSHLVIDVEPAAGAEFHKVQCDAWDEVIPP